MMRWDLINALLPPDGRFLEIGVQGGETGRRVHESAVKVGVDPAYEPVAVPFYAQLFKMTSSEFFARRPTGPHEYDVVLIDGLHEAPQILDDVVGALSLLWATGTIVLHDCNPVCEYEQRVPRPNVRGRWLGDGWKVIAALRAWDAARAKSPRGPALLDVCVINSDEGLGVIRPVAAPAAVVQALAAAGKHLRADIAARRYAELECARMSLLGLKDPTAYAMRRGWPHGA